MSIVVKYAGLNHFTKDFGGGSISHRRLLPRRDECRVKVTEFKPRTEFTPGKEITHNVDELVYVLEGEIQISSGDRSWTLRQDDFYFVPAGTPTMFRALTYVRALCVFTQAGPDGPLPDDE